MQMSIKLLRNLSLYDLFIEFLRGLKFEHKSKSAGSI